MHTIPIFDPLTGQTSHVFIWRSLLQAAAKSRQLDHTPTTEHHHDYDQSPYRNLEELEQAEREEQEREERYSITRQPKREQPEQGEG